MKKSYRVKREKDFQNVFHQGNSVANRQLVMYVIEKPQQTHFRVGFSVGKKIGNAVCRNRIKRYLRAAIHELRDYLPENIDFILIARPDIIHKNYHEIKQSIIHVMKLAKIIHHESNNKYMEELNEKTR